MKRVFSLALCIGAFALSAAAASWTGVVSEDHCGAKHKTGNAADQKCVQACVKGGAKPVLVTADGKILKIANADKVTAHLGQKVNVTGSLEGESITIETVAKAGE